MSINKFLERISKMSFEDLEKLEISLRIDISKMRALKTASSIRFYNHALLKTNKRNLARVLTKKREIQ